MNPVRLCDDDRALLLATLQACAELAHDIASLRRSLVLVEEATVTPVLPADQLPPQKRPDTQRTAPPVHDEPTMAGPEFEPTEWPTRDDVPAAPSRPFRPTYDPGNDPRGEGR